MNFQEWQKLENDALKVIDDFAAAGLRVPASASHGEALSTLERAAYLGNRARAMDAAPRTGRPVRPVPPLRPQQQVPSRKATGLFDALRAFRGPCSVAPVPDSADPVLAPDDERRAVQLSGDSAEDEGMDELRALATKCRRRSARDTRPVSDLEFYQRCAAATTRLS